MKTLDPLQPVVRPYARRLLDVVPELGGALEVVEGGHFEAVLPAPASSDAGALVCRSFGEGDVWVRFAPPDACYPVEDPAELGAIVRALLDEEAVFAVISSANGWVGTTLVRPGERPPLEPGQRARLYSWSGMNDEEVVAKAKAKKPARPPTRKPRGRRKK